jgi:F-type H+-transporting ATPase subunit a
VIELAAGPPGTHELYPVCAGGEPRLNLVVVTFSYCAFSLDSLVSSSLATAVTLALAFLIASRLNPERPGTLQMLIEFVVGYVRDLTSLTVSPRAGFVVPIAVTIALYVTVANWLTFLPLPGPLLIPANADLNQTLALAVVVMLVVEWYSVRSLGVGGFLYRFTKPFQVVLVMRIPFVVLNVIEEVEKPIALALRLFGNVFAGALMVYLLTQLPLAISWIPIALWKVFDAFFVGTIQAVIFMLLTVIYFYQARESPDEERASAA